MNKKELSIKEYTKWLLRKYGKNEEYDVDEIMFSYGFIYDQKVKKID